MASPNTQLDERDARLPVPSHGRILLRRGCSVQPRKTPVFARFRIAGRDFGAYTRAHANVGPRSGPSREPEPAADGVTASDPPRSGCALPSLLLGRPQHLSADQVLAGLRKPGLRVSKATIYNTLNLFAASGLIRQLSVGSDRCWFDSNTDAHYHFHDLDTGALMDVCLRDVEFQRLPEPPPGMQVDGIDLVIRLRRRTEA